MISYFSWIISIKQLSFIQIFATIGGVLGPLLGSLLITNFSFQFVFIVVIALLIMAVIPLFFSYEHHEPIKFTLKELLRGRGKTNGWIYFVEGIANMATALFWPIMLFLLIAAK